MKHARSTLPQVETPGWGIPAHEERATISSDLYKLGLLALRLLVGDQETRSIDRLPSEAPAMLRQIITDTLTSEPARRPLPDAWTYVLGHAMEAAQHCGVATITTEPPAPQYEPEPAAVVRTRPTLTSTASVPPSPLLHSMAPQATAPGDMSRAAKLWIWGVLAAVILLIWILSISTAPDKFDSHSSATSRSTSTTAPTTPTPRPTAQAFINDPQQRLMAAVPSNAGCVRKDPTNGSAAEVICRPGGPIAGVTFRVYTNLKGMNQEFNLEANSGYQGYTSLACPGMTRTPAYWDDPGSDKPMGQVGCGTVDFKDPKIPYLTFSLNDYLVVGWIEGDPGEPIDVAYQYWVDNYYH